MQHYETHHDDYADRFLRPSLLQDDNFYYDDDLDDAYYDEGKYLEDDGLYDDEDVDLFNEAFFNEGELDEFIY